VLTHRPRATTLKRILFYNLAHTQLGKPYTQGVQGPNSGFDCSGLVQWAAGKLGFNIPRTTTEQWSKLNVTLTPRKGDLVYFNVPSDGGGQPGHVGICADDSCSTMLNAPTWGEKVDIVPTNPAGWGRIMGYRTITTEPGSEAPWPKGASPTPAQQRQIQQAALAKPGKDCGKAGGIHAPNLNPVPSWVPLLGGSTGFTILSGCQLKALRAGLLVGAGGMMFGAGVLITGLGAGLQTKLGQAVAGAIPGQGGALLQVAGGKGGSGAIKRAVGAKESAPTPTTRTPKATPAAPASTSSTSATSSTSMSWLRTNAPNVAAAHRAEYRAKHGQDPEPFPHVEPRQQRTTIPKVVRPKGTKSGSGKR
jgi:hypothetical protein